MVRKYSRIHAESVEIRDTAIKNRDPPVRHYSLCTSFIHLPDAKPIKNM